MWLPDLLTGIASGVLYRYRERARGPPVASRFIAGEVTQGTLLPDAQEAVMSMPIAPIVTWDRVRALAESALPGAPIIADAPRSAGAARVSLARALRAAADAVAPETASGRYAACTAGAC